MSQIAIKETIKVVDGHIFHYTKSRFNWLEIENKWLNEALRVMDGGLSVSFVNNDGGLIGKSGDGEFFPIEISSIPPGTRRLILSTYASKGGGISVVLNEQGDFVIEGTIIDANYRDDSVGSDGYHAVIKWEDRFTKGEAIEILVI